MDESKIQQFCGFINSPLKASDDKLYNAFKQFCKTYCKEFYSIVHDKYIPETEGEETWHFHFVIKTVDRKRVKTVINDLAKALEINENLVTVSNVKNWCKACRYLLHLDNPEKYRYRLEAVTTSDLDKYEAYINYVDNGALTVAKLINYCEGSDSLIEVFLKMGLTNARNYRGLTVDIWQEVQKGHTKLSPEALKILNS